MQLIKPTKELEKEYKTMLADWHATGEEMVPFPLEFDPTDFPAFVERLENYEVGGGVAEGWVNHSTYWLLDEEGRIVGVSNLRHELTERFLLDGGHIGFGTRPGYRRKGYASKILSLTLLEAQKRGIEKALVTCDKDNIGSAKTILKNGGILWKEHNLKGVWKQLYWIEIQ